MLLGPRIPKTIALCSKFTHHIRKNAPEGSFIQVAELIFFLGSHVSMVAGRCWLDLHPSFCLLHNFQIFCNLQLWLGTLHPTVLKCCG